MDWNLWQGPLPAALPYSEDLHPRRWRSYWETGGGMLADWGCHLIDLLYFAYDLPAPEAFRLAAPRFVTYNSSNDYRSERAAPALPDAAHSLIPVGRPDGIVAWRRRVKPG